MLSQEQVHLDIVFKCLFQLVEVQLISGKKLLGFLHSVDDKTGNLMLKYCIDQDSEDVSEERKIAFNEYIRFSVKGVREPEVQAKSELSRTSEEFRIGFEIRSESLQAELEEGKISRKSQKSEFSEKIEVKSERKIEVGNEGSKDVKKTEEGVLFTEKSKIVVLKNDVKKMEEKTENSNFDTNKKNVNKVNDPMTKKKNEIINVRRPFTPEKKKENSSIVIEKKIEIKKQKINSKKPFYENQSSSKKQGTKAKKKKLTKKVNPNNPYTNTN